MMLKKRWFFAAVSIFCGLLNGFFGGGGGVVAVAVLKSIPDMEALDAHATSVCVMLPVSVLSGAVYLLGGALPELWTVLQVMAGTFLGGILGAKLLYKIQAVWAARAFCAFVLFAGGKMLFF